MEAGLPDLFSDKRKKHDKTEEELKESLYKEIGKQKVEIEWLKKRLDFLSRDLSVRELVHSVDRNWLVLPISAQANLLGIARQSVYYTPVPVSAKELEIKNQIDVIYTKHPFYGVLKMTHAVREERKEAVNHKRIQAYMNEMGLQAIFYFVFLGGNALVVLQLSYNTLWLSGAVVLSSALLFYWYKLSFSRKLLTNKRNHKKNSMGKNKKYNIVP